VSAALARREAPGERVAGGIWAPQRGEESSDVEHRSHTVLHIDVVTLFPEVFAPSIGLSILGRAQERGLVRIALHNLLDALDGGERADDRPFGGGPGMVLRLEPIARVLDALLAAAPASERRAIVVTAAAGRPFRQPDAERFAALDRLVVICGHYEGIDERLVELYGAQEYSLGDFVLTGGEIPALAFIDATVRLVAGTINAASLVSESFGPAGLDAPAYTRPATFRGEAVPEVLLSGDHAKIAAWRREQSRARTVARRNDLLADE
jgi:tRNA (guanine37-N1)-methyltransferase